MPVFFLRLIVHPIFLDRLFKRDKSEFGNDTNNSSVFIAICIVLMFYMFSLAKVTINFETTKQFPHFYPQIVAEFNFLSILTDWISPVGVLRYIALQGRNIIG